MRNEYVALHLAMQKARTKTDAEYMRARYKVLAHPLSGVVTIPAYMEEYKGV